MRSKKFFAAIISVICAVSLSSCAAEKQTAEQITEEISSFNETVPEISQTVSENPVITENTETERIYPIPEKTDNVPAQTTVITSEETRIETTVLNTENTDVYEVDEIPGETTETLYEAGEIPDETTEPPIDYPELEPLTAEQEQSLKEDFAAFMNETNETNFEFLPEDAVIDKYYGTYHGCEVVFMYDAEHGMTEDYVEFELGGYTFGHTCGSLDIYMHIDNGFVGISSAYDSGYLDDDDLAAIYYYSVN